MTTRFNKFGAVYTSILAMYPGTILADFDGGGANGQTVIESALDRIAREVASAMTPEVYSQITQVDCEEIVRYATANQTSLQLGLTPVVAGTVHLWKYPPLFALETGIGTDGGWTAEWYYRKPVKGYGELILTTDYTVNATTGAVTLVAGLNAGDRIFATYDTDVTAATYSLPSVADLVLLGTAAELGARLYSDAQQEWKLVEEYRARYRGAFDTPEGGFTGRALSGTWIPDELRALNHWKEVERDAASGVSSIRMYRG